MSKTRVKIIGAGSIGNHLAYACRQRDWDVTVVDNHETPLKRMREEIYPSRYGRWDNEIRQCVGGIGGDFDVIFIGTPPDTHMRIALNEIHHHPRILVIEKPLCAPKGIDYVNLADLGSRHREMAKDTMVLVGYNHLLTPAVEFLSMKMENNTVQGISVRWQESWKGIFTAHPWLKGPADSYLGFTERGGGASGEHSHGLNLFQHLANVAGWGRVVQVKSTFQMMEKDGCHYDASASFLLTTESGEKGDVFQDVVTDPAIKTAHVQTLEKGRLIWQYRGEVGADTVKTPEADGLFSAPMTRPYDFKYEIEHIADLLSGTADYTNSPLHINRGIETMKVLHYARKSSEAGGKPVDIPPWYSAF